LILNNSPFHYEFQEETQPQDFKTLFDGINATTKQNVDPMQNCGLYLRDDQGALLGGVNMTLIHGGLYIEQLWVAPQLQGQGYGRELLTRAEQLGRERGCTFVYLQTMDWEAPQFYQKQGYQVEFVRSGYQQDSKMILLRKDFT
jgi:ribosomal protein S18 acetylase RimI-like enzyme